MKRILLLLAALPLFSFRAPENIAVNCCATASSSYDNNLTAQLITDGIVPKGEPVFLEVHTSQGAAGKVDREYTLDGDTNSHTILTGTGGWIEYRPHGYQISATSAKVLCQEAAGGAVPFTMQVPVRQKDGAIRIDLGFSKDSRWRIKEVDFGECVLPSGHFFSAWMSEGITQEWVLIDLKAKSDISDIKIHWLNGAGSFDILTSDNALDWKLFKGKAKARYVKVDMRDAVNGEPFCISEIEVFGNRVWGAVAPDWQLQRASLVKESGEQLSRPGFKPEGWLPATVPGTVLSSYIDAGAVPYPDFGDNIAQISESFFLSDFWYRREFRVGPEVDKKTVLEFDGVNWKAEVFLNGVRLGQIDGAFKRASFDISSLVHPEVNALAVRVLRNDHPGAVKTKTLSWTGYNGGILGADNPTFHASIGWDWITTVRGRNCGLWNDVRIVSKGSAVLSDPLLFSKLSPDGKASMTLRVKLSCGGPCEIEGHLGAIRFSKEVPGSGEIVFSPSDFPQLADQQMRLWWPNGYGEPYLYDAGFVVRRDGRVEDEISFKAGIREIGWNTEGDALRLFVNGRRVDPVGGNWGFSQHNLRYSREQYFTAVDYHRQMNFNMIRNWVGQIGDEEFYQACDSCGIMVWQDFWLANPWDGPDPSDEGMFMDNARDLVSRIRSHPCIALYCGRNEGCPPASLDSSLSDLVREMHPGIPYIPDSAAGIVSGHGPYKAESPEYYFSHQSGKLHSERGMPVVTCYESLCRMMPAQDRWPVSEMWGKHDFTLNGAQKGSSYIAMMEKAFGKFDNASDFCQYAQWINYDGLRAMFEAEASAGRMGLLLWMSHTCWPSLVWGTYDYYFQPGAAFFACKKACEPLHIQYNPVSNKIEVINRGCGDRKKLQAEMNVCATHGNLIHRDKVLVDSPNDSRVECFDAFKASKVSVYYIELKLSDEMGYVVSDNFYILGRESGVIKDVRSLPKPDIRRNVVIRDGEAELTLSNYGNDPALRIRVILKSKDGSEVLPVDYSDNYFCLLPRESKTVKIRWNPSDCKSTPRIDLLY